MHTCGTSVVLAEIVAMERRPLAGKVAIVTGGGQGIGRACCLALAEDGARIAVVDINLKGAEETAAMCQMEFEVDAKDAVLAKFESFHIVVNNAGVVRDAFVVKMTDEQWDLVLQVNLKGIFLMCRGAMQHMLESGGGGSIINMASIVGKAGNLGQANYAASKAGTIGFTKSLAKEGARFNIRANSILPGFIETPMTAGVPQKVLEKILPTIPLGRMGKPEDVAAVVRFLASPAASYLTGTSIEVAGGLWI